MKSTLTASSKLSSIDSRSKKTLFDIILSLIVKGTSVSITFITIPLILRFVSKDTFGVWLALTSAFALINIMDIGLGDGLRNKFAEAKAQNDLKLARAYISTTYFSNFFLSSIIIMCFFILEEHIKWHVLFNLPQTLEVELKFITRILIISTSIQFFLQAFLNLLKGDQKVGIASTIGLILNLSSILSIAIYLYLEIPGTLLHLSTSYFIVPNILLLIISLTFFFTKYKYIYPSIKEIKAKHFHELTKISLKFFVINIFTIISIQAANIIIIREFSSLEVANYNLLYKYYFFLITISFILFNPLWSSFTEAIFKNDIEWILKILNKCRLISLILSLIIPILILSSNQFISVWTNQPFSSTLELNLLFGLWTFLTIYSEPQKVFIKGAGKIGSYVKVSIIFTVGQIGLTIALINYLNLGLNSILIVNIIVQFGYLLFFERVKNSTIMKLNQSKTSEF
ncbi:hypothetical protein I5M27_13995 [Adhaeribacter sp. BT258]|uniref:Membrane protein involved in the export of O-antigen and teichoic acid n=1 Tax=Adhaeribacter terrigena TaxID=2793070 RepID=A0ABS1C5Z6_9BACT|nr:hypothetical protein [Adhaeribacter terrigena]MBK0404103.1 hypothetical protein [Adhaeribacter terrigena]